MATTQTTLDFPKRVPLVSIIGNRASTTGKDAKLVNCVLEKDPDSDEYFVLKRFGCIRIINAFGTFVSGLGLGTYSIGNSALIYFVTRSAGVTRYYKRDGDSSTVTLVPNTNAAGYSGVLAFDELSLAATNYILMSCAGKLAYLNTTASTVTDLVTTNAFLATAVKGVAVLDGTTYVLLQSGEVRGSQINDPTAVWDPLNVIRANIDAGNGITIKKYLSYVIAFKTYSSQVFYDAGNSVGSPLSAVPGAQLLYGCASADTLQDVKDSLIWVSSNKDGYLQVVQLINLVATPISDPSIERLLAANANQSYNSGGFSVGGHTFYFVTLGLSDITLIYDLGDKLWYIWTDPIGHAWPYIASSGAGGTGSLLQHGLNGNLYYPDISTYTDAYNENYSAMGVALFPADIYCPNYDGGIGRKKMVTLVRFNADQEVGSDLFMRWNDNDYSSTGWSNFRKIDLSSVEPMITGLGTFRRRAFHFRHQSNTPFRIKSIDLTLSLGTL